MKLKSDGHSKEVQKPMEKYTPTRRHKCSFMT